MAGLSFRRADCTLTSEATGAEALWNGSCVGSAPTRGEPGSGEDISVPSSVEAVLTSEGATQ